MQIISDFDQKNHKAILVDMGLWAMATGRSWLVRAVEAAIQAEGLCHA